MSPRPDSAEASALAAAESARATAEERFDKLFDAAPIGMGVLGLDGRILRANAAWGRMVDRPPDELEGLALEAIADPGDIRAERTARQRLREGEVPREQIEQRQLHSDGHAVHVLIQLAPVLGPDGEPDCLIAHLHDVTERHGHEGVLENFADRDPLTSLFNRRRFEEELVRHRAHAERYGPDGALLVLDLDNLKHVNDTRGHAAGDAVIVETAAILERRLRKGDTAARLGGDEFAVLLPHGDQAAATTVAESLIAEVRAAFARAEEGAGAQAVTLSVGAALFDQRSLGPDEVLARADAAMYEAKRSGRDGFALYAATEGDQDAPPQSPRSPHGSAPDGGLGVAANLIDPQRFGAFRDDFGGESERLIQVLVDGWQQLRERIARTASEPDRHALAETAHRLAGECMLIGAAALQGAARDLEQLGRQGDAAADADIERALADVERLWPVTERALLERRESC